MYNYTHANTGPTGSKGPIPFNNYMATRLNGSHGATGNAGSYMAESAPPPYNHVARQSQMTYSSVGSTIPSYGGASGGLRNMTPVQQIYTQPAFRTGPVNNTHYSMFPANPTNGHSEYGHNRNQPRDFYSPISPGHLGNHVAQYIIPAPPPPPPMGNSVSSHQFQVFATPSYGHQFNMVPHRGNHRGGYRPHDSQPRVPKRSRTFAHFCETCSKGFDCEEDYDIHLAEDHVTCPHPGCGFNGREDVVRAHKVKHTVNTESTDEVAAWIAMRRFKFPRKDGSKLPAEEEPKTVSKLEKFIRGSIRQARIDARKRRLEREQKQPCIHWERSGKCRYGDTCSFAHEKQGVCTFFVNHGRCRHGDACKYKHVRPNSGEIEELRNPHGGLLKKLLAVETTRFENTMLQVIRYIVNNKLSEPATGEKEGASSTRDGDENLCEDVIDSSSESDGDWSPN